MRRLSVTMVALQVLATLGLAVGAVTETAASAAPANSARFLPLAPERILDTRATGTPVGPNVTIGVDVLGLGGVPTSGVRAVVINLTATNTQGEGFVQALPSGVDPGSSSSLNVERAGQTVANLAVVPLGADGRIALYSQSGADLVVDVLGAFVGSGATNEGRYTALAPARVLDTRIGTGAPDGPVGPGGSLHVPILGHGGVPAGGVSAVALNLTITEAAGDGFVQAIPTGGATPVGASSNLNAVTGQTIANLVMVPVGADGTITLFTQSGGHLLADVAGWFTDASAPTGEDGLFVPAGPARLLDTRTGPRPGDNSSTTIAALGTNGLPPSGVSALIGNITATEAGDRGFVQALPSGSPLAGTSSNLNVERAGQTLANAAVATLSQAGAFDLYTQSSTHLLFDVAGYFTGVPPATGEGGPDTTEPTNTVPPTTPGTTPPTTVPPQPGDLTLSTPQDFLGVGPHIAFSTVKTDQHEPVKVTVRNAGTTSRTVTGTSISGPQASVFAITAGGGSFTLTPGATREISVAFRPVTPVFTPVAEYAASLVLSTNDPQAPTLTVSLAGLRLYDFESPYEPSLAQVVRALGYGTNVGITAPRQRETRLPAGDELVSAYWRAADTGQPVRLEPVARFVSRTAGDASPVVWFKKGASCNGVTCTKLYTFPGHDDDPLTVEVEGYGGENQKLMPGTRPSTVSAHQFAPGSSTFGLWVNYNPADDGKHTYRLPIDPTDPNSELGDTVHAMQHTIRVYPARTPAGAVIPNTWIVAHDKFAEGNIGAVNYDYQDEVFVMTNAQPENPVAAPLPGSAGHTLDFSSTGGTVNDSAGRGTGFTSVMANSAGNQYDASRITLDTGAGVLRIRSTSGTASTSSNNQKNALQVAFDGSRGPFRVSTRFLGPLPLTAASQHIGIYVGPGQDGFMKLEVEYRDNQCSIVLYREGSGTGSGLQGTKGIGSCAALSSVDLELTGDPATGSFTAAYRLNGGALVAAFTGTVHDTYDPMGFFNRQARAGIIVANQNTPAEFTATFDRFAVTAA